MAAALDRLHVRPNIADLNCSKCASRLHFQFVFYAKFVLTWLFRLKLRMCSSAIVLSPSAALLIILLTGLRYSCTFRCDVM